MFSRGPAAALLFALNVQIASSKEALRLTGVVASSAQRDALAQRIRQVAPSAVLEISVLEDVRTPAEPPAQEPALRVARVGAPGEPVLRAWLTEAGVSSSRLSARIGEIANASIAAADLAWAEAWAMRELQARFESLWADLDDSSRLLVVSMMADHGRRLQELAAEQRRHLGGLLPVSRNEPSDLMSAVEQWNGAVHKLFAPTEPSAASAEDLFLRLASALGAVASAPSGAEAWEAHLRTSFSRRHSP